MQCLSLSLAVLATSLTIHPSISAPEHGYVEHFASGVEALDEGALDVAEAFFRTCLEQGPENSIVAFYLGCVRARMGELNDALEWVQRSVEWGYDDGAMLAWEPDLEPLRARAGFVALLEGLRSLPSTPWNVSIEWTGWTSHRQGWSADEESQPPLPPLVVGGVDLHPDGLHVALCCVDGTVRILSLADGRLVRHFRVPPGVKSLDYSPDGKRLLVSTGSLRPGEIGQVLVWEEETNACRVVAEDAHFGRFAPDGKRVNATRDKQRVLLDLASGEAIPLPGFLAWSLDGSLIAVAEECERAVFLDGDSLEPVGPSLASRTGVESASFSPDGRYLATTGRHSSVRVWDIETGEQLHVLSHSDMDWFNDLRIGTIEFSPDSRRLVTTSYSFWEVYCWDVSTGRRLWGGKEEGGGNPFWFRAAFSRDGARVYVMDNQPRVLDASTGETVLELTRLGAYKILETADRGYVVAKGGRPLKVLEGASLRLLYRRAEFDDLASLRHSGSGYVDGQPEAFAYCRVRLGKELFPLDAYAARLFDPKRLRAEIAGVPVSTPKLPRLPRVELVPAGRRQVALGFPLRVRASATYDSPLHRFEVVLDGTCVPRSVVEEATTRTSDGGLELEWTLDGSPSNETILRVAAVARDGLRSEPASLKVRIE